MAQSTIKIGANSIDWLKARKLVFEDRCGGQRIYSNR